MNIQIVDMDGNKVESKKIEVKDNQLLLIRVNKEIEDYNSISRSIEEAARRGASLIVPDWVEVTVITG